MHVLATVCDSFRQQRFGRTEHAEHAKRQRLEPPSRCTLKLVLDHAAKDAAVPDAMGQPRDQGCFCGEALVNRTAVRGIITDKFVGCNGCGRWCHAKCTRVGWRRKTYLCPPCEVAHGAARAADALCKLICEEDTGPTAATDGDTTPTEHDDDATSPPQ